MMQPHTPKNRRIQAMTHAVTLALGLSITSAFAPAWAGNEIKDINVDLLQDGSTQVRFIMASPLQAVPSNFVIDQPPRIALDFPETSVAPGKKLHPINLGNVQDLRFAESQGRARAIISLDHSTPYNLKLDGNDVLLAIKSSDAAFSAESPVGVTEAGIMTDTSNSAPNTQQAAAVPVSQVDFRLGAKGEGRLLVNMPSADAPMNMKTEGKRLIIDLPSTRLKEEKYDVSDFATPARLVTVENKGQGSRVVVENNVAFENMAYQVGKQLVVEIRPVPAPNANQPGLGPKTFTGERLTLKFQDIEVRPLLQLLADFTNNNIVVSDSVQGRMSLRLDNVPWDQALDLILTTKGLAMRKNGNVMFIAPTAEIAAQEKAQLDLIRQNQTLTPLVSDIIQINYARAQDIAKLLKPTGATGGALGGAPSSGQSSGFLSPRGTITVDDRTNTLLVNDIPDSLVSMRELVKKLDTPIKQVLIETRIVIATDNFARELGVKWGVTGVNSGSNGTTVYSGNNIGTNQMLSNIVDGKITGNMVNATAPGFSSTPANRYNINLPVTDPMGTLGLSILGSNVLVDMEISAMQSEGLGEIISSPRVLTANGQAAYIKQGKEIPYQEASSSGATTTSFKEAVLMTTVTPQITPNNNVIMDIKVQKDEPDWTRSVNGVPPLDKREVNTKVQVKNGETVVLGGIYEISNVNQLDKIPFLGDIPWIGRALFSKTLKNTQKFELLIFVTPRIVENGMMAEVQNVQ